MKSRMPCVAVYAKKRTDCFGINYGMEVNVVEYFPKKKLYDIERGGYCFYVSPEELYFPDLNSYNQECFYLQ